MSEFVIQKRRRYVLYEYYSELIHYRYFSAQSDECQLIATLITGQSQIFIDNSSIRWINGLIQ